MKYDELIASLRTVSRDKQLPAVSVSYVLQASNVIEKLQKQSLEDARTIPQLRYEAYQLKLQLEQSKVCSNDWHALYRGLLAKYDQRNALIQRLREHNAQLRRLLHNQSTLTREETMDDIAQRDNP